MAVGEEPLFERIEHGIGFEHGPGAADGHRGTVVDARNCVRSALDLVHHCLRPAIKSASRRVKIAVVDRQTRWKPCFTSDAASVSVRAKLASAGFSAASTSCRMRSIAATTLGCPGCPG